MALTITHQKVSAIADDAVSSANGEVLPSDWNATHTVTGTIAASDVTVTPVGGIAATDAQAAIAELDTEKLAASSYTAADVLSKLLTVDGAGSGLDADLLDGNSSAAFALSATSLTAGAGLTGGGDLSASRTFDVGAGTGITVNANDVALDTLHARNVDHSGVTLTAGAGLTGGGTIEASRSFAVGAGAGITVNADDVALDTASTRNTDHASVTLTAGAGLTGGGDISASRSFAVGAGTGITVNADDVAIDTTVVARKSDNLSVFAATTSAQLAGVISDETGSGALVFATSPTLVTPALGTPASGVLTNCTGLPTAGLLDDAVTYAKMQNVSATSRVLGRISSGAGDVEELTGANVGTIMVASGAIREVLTANRTYYVRTDGSDSNNGLANTAGGAFLTLQKAVDVLYALDRSIYNVTIQVGDGTYTAVASFVGPGTGKGVVRLTGNTTTPANCIINLGTSDTPIKASGGAFIYIGGFKVIGFYGVAAFSNSTINIDGAMEYGACQIAHLYADTNGFIDERSNCTISGSTAVGHIYTTWGGKIWSIIQTTTLTKAPNFPSGFVVCDTGGLARVEANTFSYPTVTVSIASPGVITYTGHGMSANAPFAVTTTGALPTGMTAGTTYYVKTVLDANTFTFSATAGGAAINTSGSQSGTHSITGTGPRYFAAQGGGIYTGGGGANYLPGNAAGTATSPGWYG